MPPTGGMVLLPADAVQQGHVVVAFRVETSEAVKSIGSVFQTGGQGRPATTALIAHHGPPIGRTMRAMRAASITMARRYKASPRTRSRGRGSGAVPLSHGSSATRSA